MISGVYIFEAAKIYNYIVAHRLSTPNASPTNPSALESIRKFEKFIVSVIHHHAEIDNELIKLLVGFSWNLETRRFDDPLIKFDEIKKALWNKYSNAYINKESFSKLISSKKPFQSFVPTTLLSNLNLSMEELDTSLEPRSIFFKGVCLLCDISGFTRLSGQYCALGKDGIDGLQRATNGYMGKLVDVIYEYGGDIIKFAGDALVCVFASNDILNHVNEDEQLRDIALHAMNCALDLREICTDTLTVHVAVSCGEICFGVIGGYQDHWECLISGDCLMQLSQCLDDAPSKHIAITSEIASLVGEQMLDSYSPTLKESGNYLIETKPIHASASLLPRSELLVPIEEDISWEQVCRQNRILDLVHSFVPTPILEALKSHSLANNIAEIREVTTMFMKWDSYSVSNYRDLISLHTLLYNAQRILYGAGAFIRQFLVDDKGCVLIACWGVPTASYLDNIMRALRAAADIHRIFNSMQMECSFGITTGNVYCGNVGSELRREFAAIGDVVNLSARLMGKSKGGVLIDDASFSRLPFSITSLLESQPPMMVKGKSAPINSHKLVCFDLPEVESSSEDREMKHACKVVLQRNLDELSNLIRRAQQTSAFKINYAPSVLKLVLVEGKPGTGKKGALRWLARQAELREIRVVAVHLEHKDAMVEYRLLAKLFWKLLGSDIYVNNNAQRLIIKQLLREIYGNDRETIENVALPALHAAFGASVSTTAKEETNNNNAASSPARRLPSRMVRDAILDILKFMLNDQVTVISIEAIHFGDEESFKCLHRLKSIHSKCLIVFTALNLEDVKESYAFDETQFGQELSGTVNTSVRSPMEWYETFHHNLQQNENASIVKLDDFNVSEIEAMLRTALHSHSVPLQLADLVHQLSGGSIFWINEIIDFIKNSSAEEFLNVIEKQTAKPASDFDHEASSKYALKKQRQTNKVAPAESSPDTDANRSKLDLFIICRFEKLSLQEQQILKTASVVGSKFTKMVLKAVLEAPLRPMMENTLTVLMRQHWITKADMSSQGSFVFDHPLLRETIYALIPSGERKKLHLQIAEHYESLQMEDTSLMSEIQVHYSHCDERKAFEYSMKAALHYLLQESLDLEASLRLLNDALPHCQSALDVRSVQKVTERVRRYFHVLSSQESQKLSTAAEVMAAERVEKQQRLHNMIFCCFMARNNVVTPSEAKSSSPQSPPAPTTLSSHFSAFSDTDMPTLTDGIVFTEVAREVIARQLSYVEYSIAKLLERFKRDGSADGKLAAWQAAMVVAEEVYKESSKENALVANKRVSQSGKSPRNAVFSATRRSSFLSSLNNDSAFLPSETSAFMQSSDHEEAAPTSFDPIAIESDAK